MMMMMMMMIVIIIIIIIMKIIISKSFRQYLGDEHGKQDIKELQKTAMLDTAHTLREAVMYSTNRLSWEIALHVP
jgi:ABC-type dipeptide/oligopeptide/nickel transport system permease component